MDATITVSVAQLLAFGGTMGTILMVAAGVIIYIVRLEGSIKVLRASYEGLASWLTRLEEKIDENFRAQAAQTQSAPARAGRGKK